MKSVKWALIAFVCLFSVESLAKILECSDSSYPEVQLTITLNNQQAPFSGSYILKINLEDPSLKPNARLNDDFDQKKEKQGKVVIAESYIQGIEISRINGGWGATITMFDQEPLTLFCQ